MGRDSIEGPTLRMVDLHSDKKKGTAGYLNLSRSSIYGMMDPKSKSYDPTFPRSIQLGAKSIAWYKADIDVWLANRPASQSKRIGSSKVVGAAPHDVSAKSNGKSANAEPLLAVDKYRPSLKAVRKKRAAKSQEVHFPSDGADIGQALTSTNRAPNLGADSESRGKAKRTSAKVDLPKTKPTFAAALGKTVESAARGAQVPSTDLKKVVKRMVKLASGGKS